MIIKHFHVINEILYSGDNLLLIFEREANACGGIWAEVGICGLMYLI